MGNAESREVSSSGQNNNSIDDKIQRKIEKTKKSPATSYIDPQRDRKIDEYERLAGNRTDAGQEAAKVRNDRLAGYRKDMERWEQEKRQQSHSTTDKDTRSESEKFTDGGMDRIRRMVEHQARMESAKQSTSRQASSKAEISHIPDSDSKTEKTKEEEKKQKEHALLWEKQKDMFGL